MTSRRKEWTGTFGGEFNLMGGGGGGGRAKRNQWAGGGHNLFKEELSE